MDDADLEMAVRGSAFGAVGTAGQRCTSLRRLLVHEKIFESVKKKLLSVYEQITRGHIGDSVLGPVHSERAVQVYLEGIVRAKAEGLSVIFGGNRIASEGGFFVEPAIIEVPLDKASHCNEELFVPILYLLKISSFEEAVRINNMVPQGLSCSLYSRDIRNVFSWISQSDCGIVNVNTGTSGAEIGGAFGGEKETGNGRESGSDSWKQYMKRTTCVVNYSNDLPLAQGVEFNL
jgi:aldehyde dehydrogenase family 7 protein A1